MEDFFPAIIVIISAMIGIISNSNKEKAKKTADARRAEAARVRAEAEKRRAATQPQPRTMMPAITPTVAETPRQAAQPKVHVHLEPDLIAHDQDGSLESPHTEGVDPCHDDQMSPRTPLQTLQAEQPGIALEWSGENMVKAFIMQEVLTGPASAVRPGNNRTS